LLVYRQRWPTARRSRGRRTSQLVCTQSHTRQKEQYSSLANGNETATPVPAPETNGTDAELSKGVNGLAISGDVIHPSAVKTAAGAPEGDVVFDHKPSESELEEVRHSLDVSRASVEGKK
jgi:hypothetical protein